MDRHGNWGRGVGPGEERAAMQVPTPAGPSGSPAGAARCPPRDVLAERARCLRRARRAGAYRRRPTGGGRRCPLNRLASGCRRPRACPAGPPTASVPSILPRLIPPNLHPSLPPRGQFFGARPEPGLPPSSPANTPPCPPHDPPADAAISRWGPGSSYLERKCHFASLAPGFRLFKAPPSQWGGLSTRPRPRPPSSCRRLVPVCARGPREM